MRKKPEKLQIDQDFKGALEELRFRVENPNKLPSIHLVGNVYKQREIRQVLTLKYPPWEIGYQVLPKRNQPDIFIRKIFFKLPGGRIDELKDHDVDLILLHTKGLMDAGQGPPTISKIAPDCMLISQEFMPLLLKERNPKVVVPGGTGHA